jgi:hypothetical protein
MDAPLNPSKKFRASSGTIRGTTITPMPLRRIALVSAGVTFIWTLCCLGIARQVGFPEPFVDDELSDLLGADTFIHGRLANPPHPLSRFFDSPYVLQRPTYASMYPPGQSLVLALGEKLFGKPYYGVLISGAAMMFLLTMTLIEWTSFLPGIVVSAIIGLRFLPPMYWVYSYWGGCVAAAGGATVLLAIGLYRRDRPIGAGVVFAVGALILFLTRPFEGGVFTVAFAGTFGFVCRRAGLRTFLLGAAPVAAAGMLWAGWYNAAVTGSPFQLPHSLLVSQNETIRLFWFQKPRPDPVYPNPRLAAWHGTNGGEYQWWQRIQSAGFYRSPRDLAASVFKIFGWTLISLLLVPVAWRDPRIRCIAAALGVCWLGLSFSVFHLPHYAAPLVAPFALLIACATEASGRIRIGSLPLGAAVTCATLAVACSFPVRSATAFFTIDALPRTTGDMRAEFKRQLSAVDGQQLVIVRYPYPEWHIEEEWVYNSANIDSQRIVFAHDLGLEQNRALLDYYPRRHVWLLTFNDVRIRLLPYSNLP